MIDVNVYLLSQSQPIQFKNVINAYTEDGLYCIYLSLDGKRIVFKYPFRNIFKIKEDYSNEGA